MSKKFHLIPEFVFICATLFMSSTLSAQSLSSAKPDPSSSESPDMASRGIRFALTGSSLHAKFRTKSDGRPVSRTEYLEPSAGISLGYAHLPSRGLGWIGGFTFSELRDKSDDGDLYKVTMARIEANLAYVLKPRLYFKGGPNVSGFTQSDIRDEWNPYIGAQAAVGVQFNQRFGVEFGYMYMQQRGEGEGREIKLTERGPEISLTATF
ncbi:MAG: hypothetical protein AB7G93_19075 [Bdellovibrionales bacterium]